MQRALPPHADPSTPSLFTSPKPCPQPVLGLGLGAHERNQVRPEHIPVQENNGGGGEGVSEEGRKTQSNVWRVQIDKIKDLQMSAVAQTIRL